MKVKAKTNCLFGYGGKAYRVKEGDVIDIDVPEDKIDWNHFELIKKMKSKVKDSKIDKEEMKDG